MEVYILHEVYLPAHFEALYSAGKEHNIIIKEYISLSRIGILKRYVKQFLADKKIWACCSNCIKDLIRTYTVKKLRNKNLIVGIAPYDTLMNRYQSLFKENHCIYFTSCEIWDGTFVAKGSIRNRQRFLTILENCFSGIACVSTTTQKALNFLSTKSNVVYHSINIGEYLPAIPKKMHSPLRLFYIGQYIERKGIDFLIRWFDENPNANVCIDFMGKGELENEINALCQRDCRCKNIGFLSKKDIKICLKNYDFMVLPTKREPFGIVIVEALAAGCPVLSSDVVGPKEIITDGFDGFLFAVNDYDSFSQKMDGLLLLTDLQYCNLVSNGISRANAFDASEIIKRWKQLLDNYENL